MPSSLRFVLVLVLLVLALAMPAIAAPPRGAEDKAIVVEAGSSHHLRLGSVIQRVSVGSTEISDVAAFPPDQILVTGKRVGNTSVTVWFRSDDVQIYAIRVVPSVSSMTDALTRAMPDARDLRVSAAGNTIVLSGEVASAADAQDAETIVHGAAAASGEVQIVNRLKVVGDHQVQIEVSFAEVSRSALKEIGFNFWTRDKSDNFSGGLLSPGTTPAGLAPSLVSSGGKDTLSLPVDTGLPIINTPLAGNFGAVLATPAGKGFPFSAALSVLAQRGYARTLSEPTLVALSGQQATFLAGGEFPIPLPGSLGQTAVDFKKFGVQLQFTPTVVGSTIQLRMSATVSDIDFALGVRLASVTVPGLTSRHSETTVRMRDGESFAIAGLLSDRVRSTVSKFPGLGDLPVLGMLFRSTSYRRDETELLVVVTARLVAAQGDKPVLPAEDMLADPSDLELFLIGSIESKEASDPRLHPHRRSRPSGPVGFAR